jgi:hypothetical protein
MLCSQDLCTCTLSWNTSIRWVCLCLSFTSVVSLEPTYTSSFGLIWHFQALQVSTLYLAHFIISDQQGFPTSPHLSLALKVSDSECTVKLWRARDKHNFILLTLLILLGFVCFPGWCRQKQTEILAWNGHRVPRHHLWSAMRIWSLHSI